MTVLEICVSSIASFKFAVTFSNSGALLKSYHLLNHVKGTDSMLHSLIPTNLSSKYPVLSYLGTAGKTSAERKTC